MIESGVKQFSYEKSTNVAAYFYDNSVDFIQVVYLKAKVKTNVSGFVTFQVCNENKCLPPRTIPFIIAIVNKWSSEGIYECIEIMYLDNA